MTKTNEYDQQAQDFLTKTATTMEVKFLRHGKHFDDDKEDRDIYEITFKRGGRHFSVVFGQSTACSGRWIVYEYPIRMVSTEKRPLSPGHQVKRNEKFEVPSAYDVLACLQKYPVDTLEDFCAEFGYDTDSRKAEKTFVAVKEEWLNVQMLWIDEQLEMLREIS